MTAAAETGLGVCVGLTAAAFFAPLLSWVTHDSYAVSVLLLGLGWGANLAGWRCMLTRRSMGERISLMLVLILSLLHLLSRTYVAYVVYSR